MPITGFAADQRVPSEDPGNNPERDRLKDAVAKMFNEYSMSVQQRPRENGSVPLKISSRSSTPVAQGFSEDEVSEVEHPLGREVSEMGSIPLEIPDSHLASVAQGFFRAGVSETEHSQKNSLIEKNKSYIVRPSPEALRREKSISPPGPKAYIKSKELKEGRFEADKRRKIANYIALTVADVESPSERRSIRNSNVKTKETLNREPYRTNYINFFTKDS